MPSYPVSAPVPLAAHHSNQLSEFHSFLLKKEITNPKNYSVWKASFKNIKDSLMLTTKEETDLLVKCLGTESSRQAPSFRIANLIGCNGFGPDLTKDI